MTIDDWLDSACADADREASRTSSRCWVSLAASRGAQRRGWTMPAGAAAGQGAPGHAGTRPDGASR